ncbi:putative F-box/LRR-repeat protein At5g54820 isoform X2 [Triticum aestivum]|uniref:putative F-box/LRR-repeat protein At5g54820 isoform X2 n=1 Tax=Triticum aestivum TaxID=4565 RepID=UPI001D011B49|nr:putative F-box/LRR-repeat protein At5g54820 isoform X2 [Triticum aestivum]
MYAVICHVDPRCNGCFSLLVDQKPMEETAAAAGKLTRLEHHHGAADPPSFRMEDLPAEVQPVIMSLLPLKEAVRTSIVSRSWRMLWTFHCDLCFDGPTPNDLDSDTDDEFAGQDTTKMKRAKFIETVNSVIQQHSGIGINKFSVRCGMHKEYTDHLDRWIGFATSSKAKIIHFNLKKIYQPFEFHHFPLEALDSQGCSFVQSLFLASVSIKPNSGISGFTILTRLVLEFVKILGDFPGLLAKCSGLEDLEIIGCYGVHNLIVPHKLDKLQHLLIAGMDIQMVEFHATDLAHFEYKGRVIPIVLNGCSKIEKATMKFNGTKALAHAFTAVPSILPVKALHLQAFISKYAQLQKLPTRQQGMFLHSRHMTCQLIVNSNDPNGDNGVLQLANCLDVAPGLESLHLHFDYKLPMEMMCKMSSGCSSGEVADMRRHDHLKTVFMSGFRCYKAQIELAFCILGNASVLEQLIIEPRIRDTVWRSGDFSAWNTGLKETLPWICEWAQLTSKRFGKVINVLGAPLHTMEASLAGQDTGSLQHHH